jgi:hypothetical protein
LCILYLPLNWRGPVQHLEGMHGEGHEQQGRAPQWLQKLDPNDVPQNPEQLQEHLVLPLGNVFSMWGDDSEVVYPLIQCSWRCWGMNDNRRMQRMMRDGLCIRARGSLLLKCGCIGLLFGIPILPLTSQCCQY